MPNYEFQSYLLENTKLVEKSAPLATSKAEKELLICFLTISQIRDLLFDSNVDLVYDIVDDFIRDVLQDDLSLVVAMLNKYDGENKPRIITAMRFTEDALRNLYEIPIKSPRGDPRRVAALLDCRERLQQAYLQLESLNEMGQVYSLHKKVTEGAVFEHFPLERTTLYFKMDGKTLSNGIELFTTVKALKEFQSVLDQSYLAISNGKNIRKSDRARYKLVAQSFSKGSFSSVVDIVLETAAPLIVHFGAANIWEYTKSAFELLQFLYSIRKDIGNKDKPPLTINGNGNNVIINNGEMTISVDKPIFALAKQVSPSYRAIAKLIRQSELDYFQLGSNSENPEIRIDQSNARNFDMSTEILRYPIKIECEILSFNKKTGSGKLYVYPKQDIPNDEYLFVVKKRDINRFIQYLLENKVVVECRQEILYDPFSPQHTKIVKLRLISVYKL